MKAETAERSFEAIVGQEIYQEIFLESCLWRMGKGEAGENGDGDGKQHISTDYRIRKSGTT